MIGELEIEAGEPWRVPRAAYIHVPFCAHHCGYCDFAVVAGRDELMDQYLGALEREMSELGSAREVATIFIGGGTPTHLDALQLERLLEFTRRWLKLQSGGEFTVEANPATLDQDRIKVLAGHGVSRISLGAQSFHAGTLRVLERDHTGAQIEQTIALVRARVPQLSLDLIFGVPGQTQTEWKNDLNRGVRLAPDHVSTYGLTYEKGTRLWKQRERGEIRALGEDVEAGMYECAMDVLGEAGFEQYEISNHARPGKRCRHNEIYWANHAYFGFGLGAARYVAGRREVNTRDINEYIRRSLEGLSAVQQSEELEPAERAKETMVIQLRRSEGVHRIRFRQQTGFDLDAIAGPAIVRFIEMRLLDDDGRCVRLTRAGRLVADTVIEGLL